ncbi:MAG TPA: N-acetylmuramoyl-L-alanine amidase [Candidatus Saccharimonadales bacterium]|nr:N-acetylmuramoyl-L-alanine amidase [Candidatus Saccharimonadales bacterium]
MRIFKSNQNLKRLSLMIVCSMLMIGVSFSGTLALSDEQIKLFDQGIYYFDAALSSSTPYCSLGSGTLPSQVPSPYNGIFTAAASKFGIPPALLASIFYGGEHGNSFPDPPPPYGHGSPWASSPTGAQGPFQFEPNTWPSYAQDGNGDGVKDVQDLTDAAFAGANYLSDLGGKTANNESAVRDVAWKYNEGPGGNPNPNGSYANNVWAAFQSFSGGGSGAPATVDTSTTTSAPPTGCSGSSSLGSITINQDGSFGTGDGLMGHPPTMIGVHYTAGNEQTVQDVISDLKDPTGSKHCNHVTHTCSVQLTVLPDGSIYQLTSRLDVVTENIINFNDADIGIEIVGKDESTLLGNQAQFKSVVALVAQLMQKYNIKMEQNFIQKSGLMGHMECDAWSGGHIGSKFSGIYSGDSSVESTDGHTDPGPTYMSNLRDALSKGGVS